jgi:hypothetical protein
LEDPAGAEKLPRVSQRAPLPMPVLMLLGNIAFIGAWALLLLRPTGWQVLGPVLLAGFFLVRVGGMWLYVSRNPDPSGRGRRTAIATTVISLLAVGLWVLTLVRGPR